LFISEIAICDNLLVVKKIFYTNAITDPNTEALKTLGVMAGLVSTQQ
jgi:hypothetical protein